jgi:hypothetical protein
MPLTRRQTALLALQGDWLAVLFIGVSTAAATGATRAPAGSTDNGHR